MRERIGYSSFIDKYGKIVFPTMFLFLLVGFISPLCWNQVIVRFGMAMRYTFYVSLVGIITVPLFFKQHYIEFLYKYYDSYQEYVNAQLPSAIFACALSLIAISILCCTIAFFVLYFAKHKTNKGLLIAVPSLYLVMVVICCIAYKAIPFVGFYTTLIFLILAILYCANAQLIPKPRQHKPTKSERIAELERQVAELTKEKDTH